MAESGYLLHGGFDEDEACGIVDQHHHFLVDKNIVCIDVGMKTVRESVTQRPALIVGVISKMPPEKLGADSQLVPKTVIITCSKVTSMVPMKLGIVGDEDGSYSFELETDVVEMGEIKAQVAEGGDPACIDSISTGTLGVNAYYEGEYRLLSNAHVLTGYDKLGSYVYSPTYDLENKLFPVTGQKPVTYYEVIPENPVYNTQDVAWAKIPDIDASKVSKTIRILNVIPKGIRPSAPSDKEFKYVSQNSVNNAVACRLQSRVALDRSVAVNSSGTRIFTFWKSQIRYACANAAGDSGSALIAEDDRIIGLHRAGTGAIGFACSL